VGLTRRTTSNGMSKVLGGRWYGVVSGEAFWAGGSVSGPGRSFGSFMFYTAHRDPAPTLQGDRRGGKRRRFSPRCAPPLAEVGGAPRVRALSAMACGQQAEGSGLDQLYQGTPLPITRAFCYDILPLPPWNV